MEFRRLAVDALALGLASWLVYCAIAFMFPSLDAPVGNYAFVLLVMVAVSFWRFHGARVAVMHPVWVGLGWLGLFVVLDLVRVRAAYPSAEPIYPVHLIVFYGLVAVMPLAAWLGILVQRRSRASWQR